MTSPSFMASGLNKRLSLGRKMKKKKRRHPQHCALYCPDKRYICSGPLVTVLIKDGLRAEKIQTGVK